MHYIPILFKISGFDPPLVCVFAWRLLELKGQRVSEDAAMVVADVLILLFDLVSIFLSNTLKYKISILGLTGVI
jgi:hypothetical protein